MIAYLVEKVVQALYSYFVDLGSHPHELISYFSLVIFILSLLKKLIDILLASTIVSTKLDFVESNLVSDNLLNIIVESFLTDNGVLIHAGIDWVYIPGLQRVYDIFERLFIFPQDLCEPKFLFHTILKNSVNLCSKTIALKVAWPVNIPYIAIELYLFLW